MKTKRLIALSLVVVMALSLTACGGSNVDSDETSEEQVQSQSVNKSNLGITMELSQDYADCIVTDIPSANLEEGMQGGFTISKEIDGIEYALADVYVVDNSLVETADQRSSYPYIFSGTQYSIAAKLPMSDTKSEDYELVSNLQSGVLQQLTSIFFSEDTLIDSLNGTDTTETGEVEAGAEVEVETGAEAVVEAEVTE